MRYCKRVKTSTKTSRWSSTTTATKLGRSMFAFRRQAFVPCSSSWLLLGALASLCILACSHDEGGPQSGDDVSGGSGSSLASGGLVEGTGAQASSGGANGGTTGGGGTTVDAAGGRSAGGGDSASGGFQSAQVEIDIEAETQDCKRNIETQCARLEECGLLSVQQIASCTDPQVACPAVFLMPGSGYAPGEIGPCADEWAQASCADLTEGIRPSCVRSGTRSLEESCRFGSQCESGYCSARNGAACGVCVVPEVPSGGSCEIGTQCPSGHRCSFGSCVILNAGVDQLVNGSECFFNGSCAGVCARSEEGDFCVSGPTLGQECLPEQEAKGARRCNWPYTCGADGECMDTPEEGPCEEGWLPCSGASYCNSDDGFAPGECVDELPAGALCDPRVTNICGENYDCSCDDVTCASAHCVHYYANVTGFCDEFARCGPAETCVDTKCVATGEPFWPEPCAPRP